jgi:hypothetical protein
MEREKFSDEKILSILKQFYLLTNGSEWNISDGYSLSSHLSLQSLYGVTFEGERVRGSEREREREKQERKLHLILPQNNIEGKIVCVRERERERERDSQRMK